MDVAHIPPFDVVGHGTKQLVAVSVFEVALLPLQPWRSTTDCAVHYNAGEVTRPPRASKDTNKSQLEKRHEQKPARGEGFNYKPCYALHGQRIAGFG